jgi:hypothetical protein
MEKPEDHSVFLFKDREYLLEFCVTLSLYEALPFFFAGIWSHRFCLCSILSGALYTDDCAYSPTHGDSHAAHSYSYS